LFRLRDVVNETSLATKILFIVPYWAPAETVWVNPLMLNESDGLFAECSRHDVVDWLLAVRRPEQRVTTTITGRQHDGDCDPNRWREWFAKGRDFFGYAWGTPPPTFARIPRYTQELEIVRIVFQEMTALSTPVLCEKRS